MEFINECGCLFDENSLSEAIKKECLLRRKKIHNKYRVFLRNSYPSICIAHERLYVHRLIWEFENGKLSAGYVVHHKDHNKLNDMIENLACLTSDEHLQLHDAERTGVDLRSEAGKWRGVNAAKIIRYKQEITKEKIEELKNSGMTMGNIAKELKCGVSTLKRRLRGRDYKVMSKIDWSE